MVSLFRGADNCRVSVCVCVCFCQSSSLPFLTSKPSEWTAPQAQLVKHVDDVLEDPATSSLIRDIMHRRLNCTQE